MAALQLDEPLYRILRAQAKNIARIAAGLEMEGTSGTGQLIKLWGPRPDIIRLYDNPLRILESSALSNWERIVTLSPVEDNADSRVIGRSDRVIVYEVQFLVRLLDSEIQTDRLQTVQADSTIQNNPLAQKMHKLIYDFSHVFSDKHILEGLDSDCPLGLVDHQEYSLNWLPGVEYPMSLAMVEITAQRTDSP